MSDVSRLLRAPACFTPFIVTLRSDVTSVARCVHAISRSADHAAERVDRASSSRAQLQVDGLAHDARVEVRAILARHEERNAGDAAHVEVDVRRSPAERQRGKSRCVMKSSTVADVTACPSGVVLLYVRPPTTMPSRQ